MTSGRLSGFGAGVLGAAGMIAVLTLASRLAGFLRWLVQAWAVGAGQTGTAYASANTVPNVLYEIVAGGALAGAVVPLIAAPLARELREDVSRIASALLTWVLLALTPVALLVVLAAHPLAVALVGHGPMTELTATFLRVFAVQIPLYGVGVVLTGVLQAHKRFFWPAFAPLMSTAVVILTYALVGVLTDWTSPDPAALEATVVLWLAWGTTAGVAALSLPLLVPVLRSGVRLRPTVHFPPGVARRARDLALAGLGTVLAQQVCVLVILRVANTLGTPGTYPVYQYANAVYALPYAVLAVPVATAVFPRIAERLGTGRPQEAASLIAASTRAVALAGVLGALLLAALAPTATALFALRGPMPGMTEAITTMSLGVLGFALMFHLTRTLFSLDAAGAAVRGAATGWLVTAAASAASALALPGEGAVPTLTGIGLGTSLGMSVAAVLLILSVRRRAGVAAVAGVARTTGVALAGAVVAVWPARLVVDALLGALPALPGALLGAACGALVCVLVLLVALWLADRDTLEVLRRRGAPTTDTTATDITATGNPTSATDQEN